MSIYVDDVTFWTQHWGATGDLISEDIARTIASYWHSSGDEGVLVTFARGEFVEPQAIRDDLTSAIQYAKTAQFDTIHELYALKDWVLHNL